MKKIIILSICAILVLPQLVNAGPIIRGGDNISIDSSQLLEGDFYGFASSVTISGSADEDVYVAGGKVTINGATAKDLSIAGGTVQVHGQVGDDLRIVGGDVVLGTPVKGDVVVIGGTLTILSTASIDGDVLFWGGELVIDAPVKGTIHGYAESVRVNSAIGGSIEFTVSDTLTLGDKANIAGNITYTGSKNIVQALDAVVVGDISHPNRPVVETRDMYQSSLVFFITILFSTLACYFVARGMTERIVSKSESQLGLYGLFGLGALVILPIIALVLMVSVVGSILGAMLLMGYVALIVLAFVLGVTMVGHLLQRVMFQKSEFSLRTPLIGSVASTIILLVPTIGLFVIFAVTVVSLGVIVHSTYHAIKE